MAERRMFSKTIIESDYFIELPFSSQALYLHICMYADDDGFINNSKMIQRMIGASEDDYKMLINSGFIFGFDSGIAVIKHWKMHNYIQNDRYKPTIHPENKLIRITNNKEYVLADDSVYGSDTQDSIGKDSIGEDSIGKDSIGKLSVDEGSVSTKSSLHSSKGVYGEYKNVFLTDNEYDSLKSEYVDYTNKIEKLSSYMESTGKKYNNHYATIRSWAKEDDTDIKKIYKNKAAVELDAYYDMTANFAKEEE